MLQDFSLDKMFEKFPPAKREKHLTTFFECMKDPRKISTTLIVEQFPKGNETFQVNSSHVSGRIVSPACSKRPRGVNQAIDFCIGPMIVYNQIILNLMKKIWAPAALGMSLKALGQALTDDRTLVTDNIQSYPAWSMHDGLQEYLTHPKAFQTTYVSFDGKGHDAHQNATLKEVFRFPYELCGLEIFCEWA